MVIETEKRASHIESDARIRAQEILAAAKTDAAVICRDIDKSADEKIDSINKSADEQVKRAYQEEDLSAAEQILSLRETAAKHRDRAVQAAVQVLTGRHS